MKAKYPIYDLILPFFPCENDKDAIKRPSSHTCAKICETKVIQSPLV